MKDREAFEKWALREGIDFLFDRLDDGQYLHLSTERAWLSWQAACKYRDEQEAERKDVNAAFKRFGKLGSY